MASKAESGEYIEGVDETAPAAGGRVDEAVQAAAGAESVGGYAQFEAGGAVFETGGWVYGGGYGEDVWCERELVAWGNGVMRVEQR